MTNKPTKFPNIHPLLLSLLFAINILIVVVYQKFLVYSILKPDTDIFIPEGNSDHYFPDFSEVPYFSDKKSWTSKHRSMNKLYCTRPLTVE